MTQLTPLQKMISKWLDQSSLKIPHKIEGIENIDWNQPVLFLAHHSFATIDLAFLVHGIYKETGILVEPLVDRWFFMCKPISKLATQIGLHLACYEHAMERLKEKKPILIAPGGIKEATRTSLEFYQAYWYHAQGISKLIMDSGTSVYLVGCQGSDDLVKTVYLPFSKHFIHLFHIPLIVPYRIQSQPLIHYIKGPFPSLKPTASKLEQITYILDLQKKLNQLFEEGEVLKATG